jgi:hypothetical protein
MKGTSALANPVPQDVESAGTEQAFLERYRQEFSRYDRPGVSVDVALFTVAASQLRVLLIQRRLHPHRGQWAFPGGFMRRGEDAEGAARRELLKKQVWMRPTWSNCTPSPGRTGTRANGSFPWPTMRW